MKYLFLIFTMLLSLSAFGGFEGKNAGVSLKIFNKINCSGGLECTRVGNGDFTIVVDGKGVLLNQVAATATTITQSQCGSTFINSGAVQMELPEASANLGCRLTFIVGNASNFDVNPDDADQIIVETDAAGDAIRAAVLGSSIVLEAISATQWAQVGVILTWADIN